jgi:hypothetical protein
LQGWWKLDGDLRDNTPYQRNGVLAGATYANDRKGAASKALTLNGVDQFVSTGAPGVSTTFSYAGWFKLNSFSTSWSSVFGDFNHNSPANGANFIPRSGSVAICIGDNVGAYNATTSCNSNVFSSSAVQLNSWVHGAMVYDGTTLKVYVNGQNIGSTTKTIIHTNTTFTIGKWASSYTSYFVDGAIDDVRVYDRALSNDEVSALYNQYDTQVNAGSGQKGMLGWWKLDGDGKDATPYQNAGVITGGTTIADRKNNSGDAYSFNVSGSKMTLTNPVGQTGQVTASVWYRRNEASSSGSWRTILGHKTANIHPLILNNTSRNLGIWDGAFRDFGYNVPNDSTWHNFAVVYNSSGTAQLYVDGVYKNQVTTTLNLGTNPIGMIGNWSGGGYWAGDIDDVRIYNRGLSLAEIQQQYQSYNSQININASPSGNQATGNINTGLLGYWPFNGNAKDTTPYSNSGTVNGAILGPDRRGQANGAYQMGTTNQWINVGSPAVYNALSNGFTLSVWLNYNGTASSNQWPVVMGSSNTHVNYGIRSSQYGARIYFEYGIAPFAGADWGGCGGYTTAANVWHLYTYTYDGAVLRTYLDGAYTALCNISGGLSPTFGGFSFTTSSNGWNGSMDDARVYNRALSASEVSALYTTY